jgi:hypothetical protein
MMQECNPYVKLFQAATAFISDSDDNFDMVIPNDLQGKDIRRYNKPTSSDIGVVIPGGSETVKSRNIVIKDKDNGIVSISELNCHYDPLMYVCVIISPWK